jgi:hypothetical protein
MNTTDADTLSSERRSVAVNGGETSHKRQAFENKEGEQRDQRIVASWIDTGSESLTEVACRE